MPRDFVITQISSSNAQNDKSVSQVPILITIPGALSLRSKNSQYIMDHGKK